MDFAIPAAINEDLNRLKDIIRTQIAPDLASWAEKQKMPDTFLQLLGAGGWYGIKMKGKRLTRGSALREAMVAEELAKVSAGVAIVALAVLGLTYAYIASLPADAAPPVYLNGHSGLGSPWWVPRAVQRVTTTSPSAIRSEVRRHSSSSSSIHSSLSFGGGRRP